MSVRDQFRERREAEYKKDGKPTTLDKFLKSESK